MCKSPASLVPPACRNAMLLLPSDMYHQAKYKDNTFIRSIVWFMYLFEVLQTILLTHDTFHQLAVSFGNMEGLGKPYLIGFELPIQSGISTSPAPPPYPALTRRRAVASITQCFYAWRIYILSGSKWFPMLIVAVRIRHRDRREAQHRSRANVVGYRCRSFNAVAVSQKASLASSSKRRRRTFLSRLGPSRSVAPFRSFFFIYGALMSALGLDCGQCGLRYHHYSVHGVLRTYCWSGCEREGLMYVRSSQNAGVGSSGQTTWSTS